MPVYEYQCLSCGGEFELLVRSNPEDSVCPACSSHKLRKKFSVFGMKSGGRFVSSAAQSCGGCESHSCSGCKH